MRRLQRHQTRHASSSPMPPRRRLFAISANGLTTYQPTSIVTGRGAEPKIAAGCRGFRLPCLQPLRLPRSKRDCQRMSCTAVCTPWPRVARRGGEGRSTVAGESSAILVTTVELAMPLIATIEGARGQPAIARAAAVCRGETGRGARHDMVAVRWPVGSGVFPPLTSSRSGRAGQVQIRQHEAGVLCYRVKPGPDPPRTTSIIRHAPPGNTGEQARVAVELVDDLPASHRQVLVLPPDVAPKTGRVTTDSWRADLIFRRFNELAPIAFASPTTQERILCPARLFLIELY